jgi:hypothetical protein
MRFLKRYTAIILVLLREMVPRGEVPVPANVKDLAGGRDHQIAV